MKALPHVSSVLEQCVETLGIPCRATAKKGRVREMLDKYLCMSVHDSIFKHNK